MLVGVGFACRCVSRSTNTLSSYRQFSTSSVLCATKGLFVTGQNKYGQIGNGGTSNVSKFSRIDFGTSDVVSVSCGVTHTAACTSDGRVWTWGTGKYGQLGLSTLTSTTTPTIVKSLESVKIVQVSCGKYHTAALSEHGHVYTWGYGGDDLFGFLKGPGCLGHGTRKTRYVPNPVEGLVKHFVKEIVSGHYHMCARTENQVFVWGNGEYGRLGPGDAVNHLNPVEVPFFANAKNLQISLGATHSAALLDGRVFTWGQNEQGQCGRSGGDVFSMDRSPTPVTNLLDIKCSSVVCGESHTVALTEEKEFYIFGGRQYFSPTHMTNFTKYSPTKAFCGKMTVYCTTSDGKFLVYGNNSYGQLGTGNTSSQREPKVLEEFNGRVHSVASGPNHSALIADI